MDNRPIGVFDSGIGGLTVVNALANVLPGETILYVGDTARVPYGNKSSDRIQQFSHEITQWLIEQDCKMVIAACNTASSLALDYLKSQFSVSIIGVISPGVNSAIQATGNQNIGVLGTQATIHSDAYGKQLRSIQSDITVVSQACPLFVPLAEEGWVEGDVPLAIAKSYLQPLQKSKVDTVILGCTHYPLLKGIIRDVLGADINLIDSGEATADVVESIIVKNNYASDNQHGGIHCFVTDAPDSFDALAGRFVHASISATTHIDIS